MSTCGIPPHTLVSTTAVITDPVVVVVLPPVARSFHRCSSGWLRVLLTGGHSIQDLRRTQKPMYTPIFTHHIKALITT